MIEIIIREDLSKINDLKTSQFYKRCEFRQRNPQNILKIEQQLLKEQLEKMQTAVTILEEKSVTLKEKPATLKEKTMTPEEKPSVTKQRAFSGRPTSFRDWRASSQKN